MRVRVVVGVALACVAVAVVVVLSQRGERLAGTNGVRSTGFVAVVGGGRAACQQTMLIDDAADAMVQVGTYGRPLPPMSIVFTSEDGDETRGVVTGGGVEGVVTFPLRRASEGNSWGEVCVRNGGRSKIALAGDAAAPATAATVAGRPAQGVIALRYARAGTESWWQLAPTIATRFGIGKADFFGGWTLPFAAVLLLGTWIVTIRLLLREAGR